MSFYGSTYYQLINAFYQIFAGNNGKDSQEFPLEIPDSLQQSTASGRQETMYFDTGNRWITITQDPDDLHHYSFWHNKPEEERVAGDLTPVFHDIDENPNFQFKTWEPDTYFKFPTMKYDEAGHLVPSSNDGLWIKLPKSEVEQDIEKLEERATNLENRATVTEGYIIRGWTDDDGKSVEPLLNRAMLLEERTGEVWGLGVYDSPNTIYPSLNKYNETDRADFNISTAIGDLEAANNYIASDLLLDPERPGRASISLILKHLKDLINTANTDIDAIAEPLAVVARAVNTLEDVTIPEIDTRVKTNASEIKRVESKCSAAETSLQNQISSNDTELSDHEARLAVQKDRLDGLDTKTTATNTDLKNEIDRAKEVEGQLSADIQAVNSNVSGLDTKYEKEIERVDGLITTLTNTHNSDKEALEQQDATLETSLNDFKATLEGVSKDTFSNLTDRTAAAETEINVLKGGLSTLTETVSSNNNTVNTSIGGLTKRIDDAEADIAALESLGIENNLSSLDGRLDTLEALNISDNLTSLDGRLDVLEALNIGNSLTTLSNEHSTMDTRLLNNETAITEIQTALNTSESGILARIKALEDKILELESKISSNEGSTTE